MLKQCVQVILVLSFSTTSFAKGNPIAGKSKSTTCVACHGVKGISPNPIWPNLAGQHQAYLFKQLKDFKSGYRKDPVMAPMVQALSEKDLEDLSAYFESLK